MGFNPEAQRTNKFALVLGSGSAGILELSLFHPVDTIAKRLMNNRTNILSVRPLSMMLSNAQGVIFTETATKSFLQKYYSLFSGFGFALCYKVSQRIYKFGGQPIVNDLIYTYGDGVVNKIGERHSRTLISAVSGSIIGLGEVILLPLDSLKVKFQTARDPKLNAWNLTKSEGIAGLYRGAIWTIFRNVPGSFALFGTSALTKEYVFGLSNHSRATFTQDLVSSVAGAITCIMVSSPLDVVKTRIQAQSVNNRLSGVTILKSMLLNEGISSFTKGVIPKIFVLGPKLVFGYTISQQLAQVFDSLLTK